MRDDLRLVAPVDRAADPAERLLVQAVGAHHRGPHHGLGDLGEHLADARPGGVEGRREPGLERPDDQDQRDHQADDRERELPREDEHQDERPGHLHRRPDPGDAAPLHELLHRIDVGGHASDEHPALLLRLLGDREAVDVGERPDPQAHHRAFRGPDQALPGDARRDVGQRHQAERGRADRADVDGPEPAVEAVVEDQLDQDRRREVRDHDAEGDDHREPEAGAQLRALPDPSPQDGEGAPELLGDLEAVVVDRGLDGAHRSPRAYAWMIAAYPGDEAISSSCEPVPATRPPSR